MKTLSTQKSRFSATSFAILFLMIFAAFGCEKEMMAPESDSHTLQGAGFDQILRPAMQCGSSVFSVLGDGNTSYGSVEMLNGDHNFYMWFILDQDQFLDDLKIYAGDLNTAPLDSKGDLLVERFPHQYAIPNGASEYTFVVRDSEMPTCSNILVWARISTRDMFGAVLESHDVWMVGNHFSNGFTLPYCMGPC